MNTSSYHLKLSDREALIACHNKHSADGIPKYMAMAGDRRPLLDGYDDGQRRSFLKCAIHGPSPRTYRRTTLATGFARFTYIILSALALYAVIGLFLALNVSIADPSTWCLRLPHKNWPYQNHPIEYWEHIVTSYPKADRAKEWSRFYTSGPHLGGQNYSQALWTKDRFEELGFDTKIEAYDIYVNYPVGHRLALLEKHDNDYTVRYEAKLEEPVLEKDTTSGLKDRIPTFHGYSANGNVTAPLVFANYGTFSDYDTLLSHNITIEGSIIIAKYGGIFRGLKVKRAQELGALGVIIYSDPADDFGITPEAGYEEYPEGPARHHQSVQRGSVQFLSFGPGDPTTPGYPSKPGCPRQDPHHNTPKIPSIPISYDDVIPLLRALNSHGPLAKDLGWAPGGLEYKDVKYNIGPTPPHLSVNLYNEQTYTITPMWNVIARIPGSLGSTEGVVVAGNHRDAWIAGGAGDPNSGTAALLEVAGALSKMTSMGWKPIRDIILASWDGEEYGLLGSTEWVEDHKSYLSKNAVAYINLDVGATGSHFEAAANPLLFDLLHELASRVPVGQPSEGKTIGNSGWNGKIRTLGSGSDYTAFQDFLGIPSSDMSFKNDLQDAVWMYHSNYDSFSWMEMFGDKGDILPMNVTRYAEELEGYLAGVKSGSDEGNHQSLEMFSAKGMQYDEKVELDVYGNPSSFSYSPPKNYKRHNGNDGDGGDKDPFTLKPLPHLFSALTAHASRFENSLRHLSSLIQPNLIPIQEPSWRNYLDRLILWRRIAAANRVIRRFDRAWVDKDGLGGGREWFKHMVFAPGRWTGYAGAVLPGLGEAWEDGDITGWGRSKRVLEGAVRRAESVLGRFREGCRRDGEGKGT
ncbi:hypothetical protein BGX38DRAFT_114081 [Terfezia claveryi]|nr:hypothetical protein BGX38DRAFT_114081 [Terfezia claveryi]